MPLIGLELTGPAVAVRVTAVNEDAATGPAVATRVMDDSADVSTWPAPATSDTVSVARIASKTM
ncbi:MAG: hypothetical protein P8K80_04640 [Phycisphaerales bacterium]|nr:hypothetical protein [Phycisphaerales bacterium]